MLTNSNPFICQDVEETCKTISLNTDLASQLKQDEILHHIAETFKIERSTNGVLKR